VRKSIILSKTYEQIFLLEAEKSGLISYLDDLEYLYDFDVAADRSFWHNHLEGLSKKRQNLFRIALLFDEIILESAPSHYDFSRLKGEGNIKIFPFEDFYYNNPIYKEGHELYAQHLKPAILPVAEKRLQSYFREIPQNVIYSELIISLYDAILLNKNFPAKFNDVMKINKDSFNLRQSWFFEKAEKENYPDILQKENRFFTDVRGIFANMYETLCWQLQISSEYDSTIMNSEYQIAKIGCESFDSKIDPLMDAYQILRVECGKMLGTLPEVNSIQEVMRLKEKRRRDLHNLRQELSHVEHEIRNNGAKKAIDKATKDLSRASKSLSYGNKISKVDNWTNHLLVPLGMASFILESPELVVATSTITLLGKTTKLVGEKVSKSNNWFELLV